MIATLFGALFLLLFLVSSPSFLLCWADAASARTLNAPLRKNRADTIAPEGSFFVFRQLLPPRGDESSGQALLCRLEFP